MSAFVESAIRSILYTQNYFEPPSTGSSCSKLDVAFYHTVEKGESLSKIAERELRLVGYHPGAGQIREMVSYLKRNNKISNPNVITEGQRVFFSPRGECENPQPMR